MFPLWGNGSGSYLRALAEKLVERGHEVAIVAPDNRKLKGIKHYVVKPPQMGVFVGHPELPKAKSFDDMSGKELGDIFTSYLDTSINAVADFNPQIIHVLHTSFLPGVARIIKILFGIKFIITTHGSDLSYLARDGRFIGLINDANKIARTITANSDFTKRWYLKMFGKELSNKCKVVMGGVDLKDFRDDPEEVRLVNKKYKLAGHKVVLFTGRLTKNKGVIYLVGAAKRIKGKVVIAGDGPERKNIEQEIKDKKIKNVILTGYIKTQDERLLHALYARADVYVAPSIWSEPLGLTTLEAMAAKTPVLATNKGGTLTIIKEGYNGFLIRPRNSKQIADKANLLLENDELRKKLSDNAYKIVEEKFTWTKIADQFEAIYKQFSYSTKEYIEIVKGVDPELSKTMTHKRNGN